MYYSTCKARWKKRKSATIWKQKEEEMNTLLKIYSHGEVKVLLVA